ncbi:MAG TPA: hypothetical protein VGU01_15425 [Sphingomicrobium sp.]|nr:hypothetical protein [Sphingomicrobium sp.]
MRKSVLYLAGVGATLALAAPAVAQYYPAPPPPASGYGYGRGYAFGHGAWQEVRELRMRIEGIRRQIDQLDRREAISGRAADRLLDEANKIDRRLSDRARDGLDPRATGDIQFRIQHLEQQVQWARAGRWDRSHDWR